MAVDVPILGSGLEARVFGIIQMVLTADARDHDARLLALKREIALERLFSEDELDRKLCLTTIDHGLWRAGLSEAELLVYAQSVQLLEAATEDVGGSS